MALRSHWPLSSGRPESVFLLPHLARTGDWLPLQTRAATANHRHHCPSFPFLSAATSSSFPAHCIRVMLMYRYYSSFSAALQALTLPLPVPPLDLPLPKALFSLLSSLLLTHDGLVSVFLTSDLPFPFVLWPASLSPSLHRLASPLPPLPLHCLARRGLLTFNLPCSLPTYCGQSF